jgi:hypothetical protein
MRRRGLVLLAVTAAAATFGVVAAWAGFPNILDFGEPTIVDGSATAARTASDGGGGGGGLADPRVLIEDVTVVGVKEGVVTTLTARFRAEYVCVKSGGRVAAGKTVLGPLETSSMFPAAKNGKAVGTLLTGPLPTAEEAAAQTGFTCPLFQRLEFDRAVFSNLVLEAEGGERIELGITLASESVHGLS